MYVIYAMDIEGLKVCSIFSDQHAGYLASHAGGLHSGRLAGCEKHEDPGSYLEVSSGHTNNERGKVVVQHCEPTVHCSVLLCFDSLTWTDQQTSTWPHWQSSD